MLLTLVNQFESHEEFLSLQPAILLVILTPIIDVLTFSLGGCSEGLDAFRCFFKYHLFYTHVRIMSSFSHHISSNNFLTPKLLVTRNGHDDKSKRGTYPAFCFFFFTITGWSGLSLLL